MTMEDAAKIGRPIASALGTARAHAKNQLVKDHGEEFDVLVAKFMADQGFEQKVITKTKWAKNGEGA